MISRKRHVQKKLYKSTDFRMKLLLCNELYKWGQAVGSFHFSADNRMAVVQCAQQVETVDYHNAYVGAVCHNATMCPWLTGLGQLLFPHWFP